MNGPAFYNLATLASIYSMFLLVLVVSLVSAVSFWSFRWYIDDFDWVVSVASLVSVVAFCCFGCHLMIFDVICPCLKPLPLSDFADLRGSQRGNNPVCLRGSNFRIFIRFPFSVSYGLLLLPIFLALFLSVVFFLSVVCINKFPLHLVHWFASTLQVGRVNHSRRNI